MNQPFYHFEKNLITIEDPELNLHYQEEWKPLLIPEDKTRHKHPSSEHFFEVFTQGPTPYAYGWIENKILDGEYLQVYADGKVKGRQYYKKGKLHGPSQFFTASGYILSDAWYLDGLQEGRCNWYYENQQIYSRQIYLKNLWHGIQLFYYPKGTTKSELNYQQGKLHGISKLFYPDGRLERYYEYDNGKLLKHETYPVTYKKN